MVGALPNNTHTPPPAATGPGAVPAKPDGETRAERKAREKAERDAIKDANDEQRRLDRLKKEEDKKQIALAKINAAGLPQQTLNSALGGIETIQRLLAGEPDAGAIGAPVGAATAAPGAPSLVSRLMKSIGLPIIIGLAVTAIWYFLKPKR